MKKLKVTAVSYLNTKPFLYGIFNNKLEKEIDLQLDIPSVCADKLRLGTVDLGLVPVAVIPSLPTPHIISNYCIGTSGAVRTVAIFSEVPIQEITHLYLDFHSRTSVALAKVLLREYWQINITFLPAEAGFTKAIKGTTAAVVIGDKTIALEERFPYIYDLGVFWKKHTGLPFVFAAWVSNAPLDTAFIQKFNAALANGLEHIPQLTYLLPSPHPNFDLKEYFQKYINYHLDEPKKVALDLFLEKMTALNPNILEKPPLVFNS